MTPEEMAVAAYNSGISHRERAAKAEAQAAKDKKDSDSSRTTKKAREEHEKALKDFTKAAELNPSMPQAYNGMGLFLSQARRLREGARELRQGVAAGAEFS